MWEFADKHPITFFLTAFFVGIPSLAIVFGVTGDILETLINIFKNGKKN